MQKIAKKNASTNTINMNYEQFAIWIHGFLEISNAETINEQQTQIIKDHLALLFEKKTPDRSKKKEENSTDRLKKLAEEWDKRIKDAPTPVYPPYAPIPPYVPFNPSPPDWVENPPRIICSADSTATTPAILSESVCDVAGKKPKTYC